ncbi:MAG: BamA/TamA family outer membrane protein [Parasphingopyxis sp.]|uniref:autotransporter assembly complex protein TamA n=1 Tax=Parasphingopyxis sp. TaxID=1920299 RepID=UPI0032ED10A7
MTGLPKPGRAFFGPLATLCALAAPYPLAAQTGAQSDAAEEVEEEVAEEVQSLNTNELGPLDGADELGAAASLTDVANFGVEWPDMSEVGDSVVGDAETATAFNAEQRYEVVLNGLADLEGEDEDDIRTQFDALSVLRENDGDPAVVAQIDRRTETDIELMRQILRSHGYYDAQVAADIVGEQGGDGVDVVFDIETGPLYRFERVELPGLASAGERTDELRAQFDVEAEDPVDAATVTTQQARLSTELGNRGYPFARVGEEEVVVDHANRIAILTQPVDPGGERDFGSIRVTEGEEAIFGAEHVATIARFRQGELYSTGMVDDLRRALIQTGLISRVELTPVDAGNGELVDIAVAMEPAPPRTVAGSLGYDTGRGARVEASWEHRNLFRPEGALTIRGIAGTEEQLASIAFRRNNFLARDQVLTAQIYANNLNRDAYDARTAGFTASFARITNQLWQKDWYWSVGAELLASDERDIVGPAGQVGRRTFFIAALPLGLNFDSTNDLLNPEQGFRLGAFISPEASLEDGFVGYARVQLDGSFYFPATDALTLAGRVRVGSMPGATTLSIAPSRRFYAGGGGSVRGYSYQSIGPRDANNDPIGGRSLFEVSLEGRYRFGNFGIVPFIDAGAIYDDIYPDFSNLRFGAGLGLRYYSNFGPIRIDVGTPLNPQPGDAVVAVYVSLGQAF